MPFQMTTSLLTGYLEDSNWKPWFNSIDSEVASEATCENPDCKHVGLQFLGFQGYGERHAVAICPICSNQFEF